MAPRVGIGLARYRVAHVRKGAATALALCREEAQQARLPRARAAPRGLEVTLRLLKAAALAIGLSCSVQGRGGGTHLLWPRARPAYACAQENGHCARSLSGGGAARALAARARFVVRVGIGPSALECRRASDRALSFAAKGPHEQNCFPVPIMLPPAQTRAFPQSP